MSIINEALKKAREKRERSIHESQRPPRTLPAREEVYQERTGTPTPKYSRPATAALADGEHFILRNTLFAVGAIVLISVALFILVRQNITYTIKHSLSTPKRYPSPLQPLKTDLQQAQAVQSKPIPQKTPEFLLTGIVSDKEFPMAIINGEVYTLGDRVGTARVVKISEKVVILDREGEKIELQVK